MHFQNWSMHVHRCKPVWIRACVTGPHSWRETCLQESPQMFTGPARVGSPPLLPQKFRKWWAWTSEIDRCTLIWNDALSELIDARASMQTGVDPRLCYWPTFLKGNLFTRKSPNVYWPCRTSSWGLFYWPQAILGDFYWPGAMRPLLASSPDLRCDDQWLLFIKFASIHMTWEWSPEAGSHHLIIMQLVANLSQKK